MTARATRFLRDALGEAYELRLDLADQDLSTYEISRHLQRLTERSLEIIGESIRRACNLDESLCANHSELREWIALRNIISHQYDKILPEAIWSSATDDIDDLIALLESLTSSPEKD